MMIARDTHVDATPCDVAALIGPGSGGCKGGKKHQHERIITFPKLWCFHILRWTSNVGPKLQFFADMPARFSVYDFTSECQAQYECMSMIVHDGSIKSGHYTILVRKSKDEFFHIDPGHSKRNPTITTVSEEKALKQFRLDIVTYARAQGEPEI